MSAACRMSPRSFRSVTFVDHGDSVERDGDQAALLTAYANARGSSGHLIAKAGDTIPVAGLDVRVISAAGKVIDRPLPRRRYRESAVRQFSAKRDRYGGKRPVGGRADYLWQVPHDRSRGSHVERRTPARMPGEPDWPRGSVPHDASWLRQVRTCGPRARTASARRDHEQWRPQRGIAVCVADRSTIRRDLKTCGAAPRARQRPVAQHDRCLIANPDESTSNGLLVVARQDGSFTVTNPRTGRTKTYAAR